VRSQPNGWIIGEYKQLAGVAAAPPAGWLACDGREVSRTTYAQLYTALGGAASPHGQGNGISTFNIPDARGCALVGADGMFYGTSAGRLASVGSVGPGFTGGEATHTLTTAEMPAHEHPVYDIGHTHDEDPHTHGVDEQPHDHGTPVPPNVQGVGPFGGSQNAAEKRGRTDAAVTNISIQAATPVLHTALTGITIASAGSGAAHNNVQPILATNVIVYAGV
jgi:microcystin-dependent protein